MKKAFIAIILLITAAAVYAGGRAEPQAKSNIVLLEPGRINYLTPALLDFSVTVVYNGRANEDVFVLSSTQHNAVPMYYSIRQLKEDPVFWLYEHKFRFLGFEGRKLKLEIIQ
jgi:hypothetical protein